MSDENGTLASHSITVGVPTATYLCMQSKLLNILYQQYNNNQLRRLFKELWEGQEVLPHVSMVATLFG